jgi:cytochrome P450
MSRMSVLAPPIWNPFQIGYMENPYLQFNTLREHNPVHKGINGRWMLFRYDDVKLMFTNPNFKTLKISEMVNSKSFLLKETETLEKLTAMTSKWLLFLDPPIHAELRVLVAKVWNSFDMSAEISKIVDGVLADLETRNEADIVNDFAVAIPSKLICRILGFPMEDYGRLRNWTLYFNRVLEPFESIHKLKIYNQKAEEFYDYLEIEIAKKMKTPEDDFISKLISSNQELDKPLSLSDLISIISVMFFAGIETSVNLFGQSILHFLRNPDQARFWRENDYVTPRAVDELVRFISPAQLTTRVLTEDIEIRGCLLRKGEIVMGSMAAANRDPDVFENPDDFEFFREKNPHMGFGYGLHFCLGARLAKEEMGISIPALLRKFPEMRLHPERNYQWDTIVVNRGLKELPVLLT